MTSLRTILAEEGMVGSYSGNPDGKPIYPNRIDHGYEKPVSGGTDVMKGLVKSLRREQGLKMAVGEALLTEDSDSNRTLERMARALKAEGLPNADGWAVADRFKGLNLSAAKKEAVQVREDWGKTNGKDWKGFLQYLGNFAAWRGEKAMDLAEAMYDWQDAQTPRVQISTSDDEMGDMSKAMVLQGKADYERALKDPGLMPRRNPHTFKVDFPGAFPGFSKLRWEGLGYLLSPWQSEYTAGPPKGWSDDALAFRGWGEISQEDRAKYLDGLFGGRGMHDMRKFMKAGQRGFVGIPHPDFKSKYWDIFWMPDTLEASKRVTNKGFTLPLRLYAMWSGIKSKKKDVLEDALKDTEKSFKRLIRMDEKIGGQGTLAERTKEHLRLKNPRTMDRFFVGNVARNLDVPLVGDTKKDQSTVIDALSRPLK